MLTRTLALEVAEHGINVNNLAHGMVLTPFNQAAIDDPDLLEKQVQSIPLRATLRARRGELEVVRRQSDVAEQPPDRESSSHAPRNLQCIQRVMRG